MTDNRFLQDVNTILNQQQGEYGETLRKNLAALRERGVDSYDTLFSLLRDVNSDTETLVNAYRLIAILSRKIDKRRAAPPLLKALKSDNSDLRQNAVWVLGTLGSKRAIPIFVEIVKNRAETQIMRIFAIQALSSPIVEGVADVLRDVIADTSDDPEVRNVAIENLAACAGIASLNDYIALLSNESADMRFWAAYGLSTLTMSGDISAALSELDRIAAFDHIVPTYWGWHVDREALQALESIYAQKLLRDSDECFSINLHLISPMPEYDTYMCECHKWHEDWLYETLPLPAPSLNINPTWLAEKLRAQYPDIELGVRQPKPQTYLLDWRLTINEGKLIGGLHRDGYAIVLMGDQAVVSAFAAWYRSVISSEHKLYLYKWADSGVEIT